MKMFDSNYVEKELKNINNYLNKPINIYIFGGGAMSFYDLKIATKDIDVLLPSEAEASALIKALYKSGYNKSETKDPVYIKMKTREIIENTDGFRWDIFVNKICGGLTFSMDMQKRSKRYKEFTNIKTYLVSPEDIFILKSVTSRLRDREDMFTLFSHGLNIEIIKKEIQKQAKLDENKAWLSYFFIGLDELVSEYNVIFPNYDEFLRLAEEEMLEKLILEFIQKKPRSLNDLASIFKCDKNEIKRILEELMKQDKISRVRGKFNLNKKYDYN
ncbi:hypothetical protein B6U98_05480 [Thermoplasmatales archaeon ex4572_165]|nr:MAG: hypothetical protein B6U98_05480 [Thermoplasmatales archaeon ex4572_165]